METDQNQSSSPSPRQPVPGMDVVPPPAAVAPPVAPAPTPAPAPAADKPADPPAVPETKVPVEAAPAKPTKPAKAKSGSSAAVIFLAVVIFLGLAALSYYAYVKSS